jgi:hypothetical protein
MRAMRKAEILLNLVIGICGSLIASIIYSHLQKIHWGRIFGKAKVVTNGVLIINSIAFSTVRSFYQRYTLAIILVLSFIFMVVINTYLDTPESVKAYGEYIEQACARGACPPD